jgi:phage baseplate assembly protein gpV
MSDMVEIIRKIIQHELSKIRIGELGVVTSIFPHSGESDKDNYECNVKLKNSGLELRKVPIATNHIGTAAVPNVEDLVLVSFVAGDVNQPIVVGRLYNDKDRPPVNNEKEYILESPYKGSTSFKIDTNESIILSAGGTMVTLKKDGDLLVNSKAKATITVEGDTALECKGNVTVKSDGKIDITANSDASIQCVNCKIKASGNIDLGEGGGGVVTNMSHKCFLTGAPPIASVTVKAKM